MRKIFAAVLLGAVAGQIQSPAGPRLIRRIELPGVQGRIDHLALDAARQVVYVAALGNNTVEVLDVRGGSVSSLRGFQEPQGIAVTAGPDLVAVANGEGEGIVLLDANDRHVVRRVTLGDDADNVRYEAAAKRLYVGYGSGAIAAVDPAPGETAGRVELSGHPESFQLEQRGGRMYVNVPTAGQIAVVIRASMKVTATWPVTSARSNFPMALDEPNHRLFVGCRRPAKVLVYDTRDGRLEGTADIVGDTDALFYDASRGRLYVTGGEGFLDVFDARDAARLTRVARVATSPGARTSLFDPGAGVLYVAVPRRGSQNAEIRVYDTRN